MMSDRRLAAPNQPAIVLFDGECVLCNRSVRWIIRHDPHARFRFAALRSAQAVSALEETRVGPDALDSIVLIDSGRVLTRSDAVLGIARRLGLPWSVAIVAGIIPRPWRDRLYRWIARNRYPWFGRDPSCPAPTPEVRRRFLDQSEPAPPGP